jgi:hypothetical protein
MNAAAQVEQGAIPGAIFNEGVSLWSAAQQHVLAF